MAGMLAGPAVIAQILDIGTPTLAFLGVSALTAIGLVEATTLRSR